MKHFFTPKGSSLFFLISLFPFAVNAQGHQQKAGLTGEISIIAGMLSSDSNLSTHADTKTGGILNSSGSRHHRAIVGPIGELNYRFGSQAEQAIMIGASREDLAIGIMAVQLGYEYTLNNGMTLGLSYLPNLFDSTVWSDPYVINTARTESDKSSDAIRFKIKRIAGLPLSLDLAYATNEIDAENSGAAHGLTSGEQALIKRDGNVYYSKLTYRQFLGAGVGIAPSVKYTVNDSQGDAMSYEGLGYSLSYFSFLHRNKVVFTVNYEQATYDTHHPIFLEKREDTNINAFVIYEYSQLWSLPSLSLTAFGGYSKTNSNIPFFESNQYILASGLTYRF